MQRPTEYPYPADVAYPTTRPPDRIGSFPSTTAAGSSSVIHASFSRRTALEPPCERLAPLELPLVHLHGEPEPCLERVVLGIDVLPPEAIPLLQTQGVERAEPGGDQAVFPAGLPEQVPGVVAHRELPVQLPPELSRVGDPLGPDGADLPDVQVPSRHVWERVVAETGIGDRPEDLARPRPPEAEREE